jgi:hypothetical protein
VRVRRCALQFGAAWMLVFSVVLAVNAAGPVDIYDAGDHHESIGQADEKTPLTRGVTYHASAFPIDVRVRPADPLWGAVQLRGGRFRLFSSTISVRASCLFTAGATSPCLQPSGE